MNRNSCFIICQKIVKIYHSFKKICMFITIIILGRDISEVRRTLLISMNMSATLWSLSHACMTGKPVHACMCVSGWFNVSRQPNLYKCSLLKNLKKVSQTFYPLESCRENFFLKYQNMKKISLELFATSMILPELYFVDDTFLELSFHLDIWTCKFVSS